MNEYQPLRVSEDQHGLRLDAVLQSMLPDFGLRARRRLCDRGAVLVNDRARPKGFRVRSGDRVQLRDETTPARWTAVQDAAPPPTVQIVKQSEDFAAVFKPSGIHSQLLRGSPEPTIEALLPGLFERVEPELLNRLDKPTSGLLLIGLRGSAQQAYRSWQADGRINKDYLALVEGGVTGPRLLPWRIESAERRAVSVTDRDDPDQSRWTHLRPMAVLPGRGQTLVEIRIHRGRRHQIRAHLAHSGHPVVGDRLYGPGTAGRLYLHHWRIELPGFTARALPDWWPALSEAGLNLDRLLQLLE